MITSYFSLIPKSEIQCISVGMLTGPYYRGGAENDGHENAGHEIAGQKIPCLQRLHYVTMKCAVSGCCYFLRHKHSNALCVSYYLFRKKHNLLFILKQRQ